MASELEVTPVCQKLLAMHKRSAAARSVSDTTGSPMRSCSGPEATRRVP